MIMGQTGMAYGISVFDDVDALRGQLCGRKPAPGSKLKSVRFEAPECESLLVCVCACASVCVYRYVCA